jgi:hypothetical protein
MIRVLVREKKDVDPRQSNMTLPKSDRHASTDIEKQLLFASLDQRTGTEPT